MSCWLNITLCFLECSWKNLIQKLEFRGMNLKMLEAISRPNDYHNQLIEIAVGVGIGACQFTEYLLVL